MSLLTTDNFNRGFLVDEELMGGVSQTPEGFIAFVLRHTTGEYLGYQPYPTLDEALGVINQVQRPWAFEASSGCGSGKCGESAQCGTGACPKVAARSEKCSTGKC